MKLSVLIPLYNSERTIARICERLIGDLSGKFDLEIVLVNDSSEDSTDSVCKNLVEKYSGIITYIELAKNFGEHNALMAGFLYVTGDYCITMDDDLQHPPEEVHKLIEEIQKGFDVVYSYHETRKYGFFRNFGSNFHNSVANIVLRKPAELYLSSFKIINKFVIGEIVKYIGPDPYVDGIILRTTEKIGRVRTEHAERRHGRSGYTFNKLVSLWGRMVVNFSLIPLRIIGLIGFCISLISLPYGVYHFFYKIPFFDLTDTQLLITILFFISGFILMSISLLGEYIGRVYLFLNNDPQFIIRSISPESKNK